MLSYEFFNTRGDSDCDEDEKFDEEKDMPITFGDTESTFEVDGQ